MLKCIDKEGGLDNYLVNTRDVKIDSLFGSWLKKQVASPRTRRFRDAVSHTASCPAVLARWHCVCVSCTVGASAAARVLMLCGAWGHR